MENAIIANIIKFLQELGVGFSLLGRQYHIRVSDKDYYVDLLFYHTRLHCYVAVELKVTEFMPEYAGKLEFYINAIDEQLKMPEDNPTIGLLLCKIADKIIVEYSLKTKTKPMGVAEYKHAIPKKWKNELPDENLLKQELEREIVIPQKPLNEKIERLKEIISKLNEDPADLEKDDDIVRRIHNGIQQPLINLIDKKLAEIKPMFNSVKIEGRYNQKYIDWSMTEPEVNEKLLPDENIWMLGFEFTLDTFIQGGTKAFTVSERLEIHMDKHKYIIGPSRGKVWKEKVYRKMLTTEELEEIADQFAENLIESANHQAENILTA